jgi:hypothetical protein
VEAKVIKKLFHFPNHVLQGRQSKMTVNRLGKRQKEMFTYSAGMV